MPKTCYVCNVLEHAHAYVQHAFIDSRDARSTPAASLTNALLAEIVRKLETLVEQTYRER